MSQSYVHYHSLFLLDLLIDSKKRKQGITSIILGVTSIEALVGDLAQTLIQRRDAKKNLHKNTFQRITNIEQPTVFLFPQLNALELAIAAELEELLKRKASGLNMYYVLFGLLEDVQPPRNASDSREKKEAWKQSLPSGVDDIFSLRNAIIHRHGSELLFDSSGNLINGNSALPDVIEKLNEELNLGIEMLRLDGWLGVLENNEAIAEWSLKVTQNFILHTLAKLPATNACDYFRQTVASFVNT